MKRVIFLFVLALGIMLTQTNVFAVDKDVGVIKTEITKMQKIAPIMITTNFPAGNIFVFQEVLVSKVLKQSQKKFLEIYNNPFIIFLDVGIRVNDNNTKINYSHNLCNLHKTRNTDILHSRQWFGTHFGKIDYNLINNNYSNNEKSIINIRMILIAADYGDKQVYQQICTENI